jgi:hypothetical protein
MSHTIRKRPVTLASGSSKSNDLQKLLHQLWLLLRAMVLTAAAIVGSAETNYSFQKLTSLDQVHQETA